MHLNPSKVGLAVGLFLGAYHLVWSILVAIGWGQAILDFVFWAHMIHMAITVGPFDVTATATLIVLTFVVGYVIGFAFAWIWNKLHRA